jgi:hypothetical protein
MELVGIGQSVIGNHLGQRTRSRVRGSAPRFFPVSPGLPEVTILFLNVILRLRHPVAGIIIAAG